MFGQSGDEVTETTSIFHIVKLASNLDWYCVPLLPGRTVRAPAQTPRQRKGMYTYMYTIYSGPLEC